MIIKFNFDWICFDTKYAFSQIETYFVRMNGQIEELKSKDMESIKSSLKNIENIEDYELESSTLFQEHYHQYEDNLPRCHSYSFVTMIYTTLETRLNELCNDLIEKRNLNLNLENLKGSLAERVKLFFKAFNLKGLGKKDIDKITEFSRVRNQIVHENGHMHNASKKLKNYLKNTNNISVENNLIVVEIQYCLDNLSYFKSMFANAFRKLGYKQDYTVSTSESKNI